ncbi:hypothetical protein C8Q77DRAFT_1234441 [Trametes polyzona]|nr:hypothetical protein C8Q77DRAFT_1234441 [Trametes polyzona]
MDRLGARSLRLFLVSTLALAGTAWAGNTTCASGQLDWYSSVVGESPCVTYQRLRQVCNNDYQVPDFRPNTPGDQCDDQVSACCCNTVAFQLSMLCMNCQQDHEAGNQIGIDAGVGAYGLYRGTCGAGTNHSLPNDIQKAVCNLDIRLDNFLYGGWDDGSCVYTKESAGRDHAVNNNNTFTHCPNQISPSVTPTPTSSGGSSIAANPGAITSDPSRPTSAGAGSPTGTSADSVNAGQTSSSSPTGAIAGGVIGGVVVIAAIAGFLFWRRRRAQRYGGVTRGIQDPPDHYEYHDETPAGGVPQMITPFGAGMVTQNGELRLEYSASQAMSPESHVPPASWSDFSSAVPQSTSGSDSEGLRHTDAGVIIPLSRSASGRLPPAYRSWEDDSNVGSDAQTSHLGSATSPTTTSAPSEANSGSAPSEVSAGRQLPLVPLRLDEKRRVSNGPSGSS